MKISLATGTGSTGPGSSSRKRRGSQDTADSLSASAESNSAAEQINGDCQKFASELTAIFKISDEKETGELPYITIEELLQTFHIPLSPLLIEVMCAELHVDQRGNVKYMETIDTLTDLFEIYKARAVASAMHSEMEKRVHEQALRIADSTDNDIHVIVKYLKERIRHIQLLYPADKNAQLSEYKQLFENPHSGLSSMEGRILNAKLFNHRSSSGHHHHHHHDAHDDSKHHAVDLSAEVLFKAIKNARVTSIVRTIMEEVDSNESFKYFEKMFWTEHARLVEEGKIPKQSQNSKSAYLPIDSVFNLLQSDVSLRLHRGKVMFILSWADCFDKEFKSVDIIRFARHCSSILSNMSGHEACDLHADVLENSKLDHMKVFNGATEEQIEDYISKATLASCDKHKKITSTQVLEILKNVPQLNINDRELATLSSALNLQSNHAHQWEILHPLLFSSIHTLCSERTIQRRVSLAVFSVSAIARSRPPTAGDYHSSNRHNTGRAKSILDDSSKRIKEIADKILSILKIAVVSGEVVAQLPLDNIEKRSGTRALGSGDSDVVNGARNEPLCKRMKLLRHEIVQVVVKKSKGGTTTTLRTSTTGSTTTASGVGGAKTAPNAANVDRAPSMANMPSLTPSPQSFTPASNSLAEEVTIVQVPSLVSIYAEDDLTGLGTTLVAHIVTVGSENNWIASLPLPMKLPSIAMVDLSAAAEFATNLFDRIYLETRNDVVSLKLEEVGGH